MACRPAAAMFTVPQNRAYLATLVGDGKSRTGPVEITVLVMGVKELGPDAAAGR